MESNVLAEDPKTLPGPSLVLMGPPSVSMPPPDSSLMPPPTSQRRVPATNQLVQESNGDASAMISSKGKALTHESHTFERVVDERGSTQGKVCTL